MSGWAGFGVANLVAVFDPEVIVVGGGLGSSSDHFLSALKVGLGEHLCPAAQRAEPLVLATAFGADAGMLGAAMMASAYAGADK